jgi:hypothetical protein
MNVYLLSSIVKRNSTGAVSDFMTVSLSVPVDSDSDMMELAIVDVSGSFSVCAWRREWTEVAAVD